MSATLADRSRTQPLQGENFPVALRVLPRAVRRDLGALYAYARHVDDLGDEGEGDRRARLAAVRAEVDALYDGGTLTDPAVAGLVATIASASVPREPLLALVRANEVDQDVSRYATFDELLGYCALSANPVGHLVLHVFGAHTPERVALSDRVCTALQLLEHLQDLREDHAAGRVYLPQEDLLRFGVAEDELARDHASPAVRALVGFETDRALAWLEAGAVLAATLHGWARLAVQGYLAGGRAAADRLRASGWDPLPAPPKPRPRDVVRSWLTASVSRPG